MNRLALAIVTLMLAAGTAAADVTCDFYEISANGFDGAVVHINQDGRVWVTR